MEPFKFKLEQSHPAADVAGGVIRFAKKNDFPALDGLAMASIHLHPGGVRIPHWHPNANEMDYVISGKCRINLFGPASEANPDGITEVFTLEAGEISFLPQGWFHSIENTGKDDLHILVIFNNAMPEDIGISRGIGAMVEPIAKTIGVPEAAVARFHLKVNLIAPQ